MDRTQAAAIWPLVKAFGEGKPIQFNQFGDTWYVIDAPNSTLTFEKDPSRYRILAPKPFEVSE